MRFLSSIFCKRAIKYWLLLAVFIASSWPLLQPGMFQIHDFTHGARIAEMTRALQDGHFPVRWSQNFGYGYGMPLFQFYGPLPFYLGAVYYWLTNSIVGSVKFIFLIVNFFTLLGGYLMGKKLFKTDLAALVTSLAFALAPYRFLNLYVRGALNELWGMMALPWIVWGAVKIVKQEKWGWLSFTLSLSVLFLSHNISTMIFAPFIIGLVVLLIIQEYLSGQVDFARVKKIAKNFIFAGLLAVGLSSFYLFPAYLEKDLTQVDRFILADYFNFRIHFLYIRQFFRPNWGYGGSQWGPDDPISFFLGYGQILLLFLAFLLLLFFLVNNIRKFLNKKSLKNLFFPISLLSLLIGSLLMNLHRSEFIWNKISVLEFVQFPWRFLGISSFLLAMINGWAFVTFEEQPKLNKTKKLFVFIFFFFIIINLSFARPEFFLDNPKAQYYSDPERIRTHMSGILPDYLPQKLNPKIKPVQNLLINNQDFLDNELEILINRTHEKLIRLNINQEKTVRLAVAHYPGWQGWLNNEPININIDDQGSIYAQVPEGSHLLGLRLTSTQPRIMSDYISLGSLTILFTGVFIETNKKYQKLS